MPRTYKRLPGTRPYVPANKESLEKAVKMCQTGELSYREAAEQFGVDKMKIYRTLKGIKQKTYGGQTTLTEIEETLLKDRLLTISEWGFPLTQMDLRLVVKNYLDTTGHSVKKFSSNNLPGLDWVKSFMQRHKKDLTDRLTENIKRSRAEVSADTVNQYFDNLEVSLSGVQACSIVNYDETNLTDDPGKKRVICRRGKKHPENIIDFAKSSTSLMFSCSANGILLPVYVVYKAEHLYESWTVGGPKSTRYGNSKSGWFDQINFEEWFKTIALPYLKTQPAPRVLIGDNLGSHFSYSVISLCNENDIRFLTLPKRSTHLAQPLDVSFFHPLKVEWRKLLTEWRNKGNKGTLSKVQFPPLLKQLLQNVEKNCAQNIRNGFRKTGLVPLQRQEILQQLPNQGIGANPLTVGTSASSTSSSIDESFIGLLREMRYGKCVERRNLPKRRRINVEPGKSVGNLDSSENESEPDTPGCSFTNDKEQNFVDTSRESDEHEWEMETEDNATGKMKIIPAKYEEIEDGQYLLINLECATNKFSAKSSDAKNNHLFPAKVTSVESSSSNSLRRTVKVKFMKQYRAHKDTFVWPDVEDTSFIYPHEVVSKLPEPKVIRYGRMQFPFNIL